MLELSHVDSCHRCTSHSVGCGGRWLFRAWISLRREAAGVASVAEDERSTAQSRVPALRGVRVGMRHVRCLGLRRGNDAQGEGGCIGRA